MSRTTKPMAALKARLKATWNAGDYGVVAKDLEPSATAFLEYVAEGLDVRFEAEILEVVAVRE